MKSIKSAFLAALALSACASAFSQEAVIRKNLPGLIPKMPAIDQVSTTPIAGLWEVRVGSHIMYTDPSGTFVIEGQLTDMRTRTNLTQERISESTAINFALLPLKDAIVTHKSGKGERKMAVFADPNCGYCKRFEIDLAKLENTTVYTFLIPVLGASSETISRNVLCSDNPAKSWTDWMLSGKQPASADAKCDSAALERNKAFAIKYAISSTPTSFFEPSVRRAGALPLEQVNKLIDAPIEKKARGQKIAQADK